MLSRVRHASARAVIVASRLELPRSEAWRCLAAPREWALGQEAATRRQLTSLSSDIPRSDVRSFLSSPLDGLPQRRCLLSTPFRGQQKEGAGAPGPEAEAATSAQEQQAEQQPGGGERGAELDSRDEEIAALKERLLLAYADMENLRERMRRENDQVKLFAVQGFAKGLLDVADNLARASSSAAEAFEGASSSSETAPDVALRRLKSLLEGVQATERQLLKVFKSHGLERFNPEGEQFDPNKHEAMFELPEPSKDPGTVLQVLKDGYMIHGRVLRAAEVGVVAQRD